MDRRKFIKLALASGAVSAFDRSAFAALVKGWRREFGNPKLPFYYVQLAPHGSGFLPIQLQQAAYEPTDPNAEMVVVNDVGNIRNIHPRDEDTSLAADFELQWPDGRWQKATIHNFKDVWVWYAKRNVKNGTFAGNRIELSVYGLDEPQAVRYLHNSPWQGSVFNQASLPLGVFERKIK